MPRSDAAGEPGFTHLITHSLCIQKHLYVFFSSCSDTLEIIFISLQDGPYFLPLHLSLICLLAHIYSVECHILFLTYFSNCNP